MVIIPTPIQEEPTDALTAEEASVASLSPGLPPVLTPDEDVDRLSLEGASNGPTTPPAVSPEPHFIVPSTEEVAEVAARHDAVISAQAVEASVPSKEISARATEVKAPQPSSASSPSPSPAPSPPQAEDDTRLPTFSQYLFNLVAPENLEQYRRPMGYSLTALCYGLTWYLVTQTPGMALI